METFGENEQQHIFRGICMYLLERFLAAYNDRALVRRSIWGLLPITAIILALLGGLPPRPWRSLAQALPQADLLWQQHGAAIILPLLLLLVQAIDWALLWLLPFGGAALAARHWWKQRHGFEFEFVDETEELELAPWPDNPRAPTGSHFAASRLAASQFIAEEEPDVARPTAQVSHTTPPRLAWPEQKETTSLLDYADTNYATGGQIIRPSYWHPELAFSFDIGANWDAGKKRKDRPNEDSLVALQGMCIYNSQLCPFGFFVVADGMGGHANGQDASYLAIQSLLSSVLPAIVGSDATSDELLVEILATGVQQANRVVYQRGQEVRSDMGTTITAALVVNTRAFVVNVGDSRTYLYRRCDGLLQITHDHSHVARLVAAGQIARDDIYTHPERNQIYRALGSAQDLEVDWFTLSLQGEDCLLLCSDGLWEMVRDQEIERIFQQRHGEPSLASKELERAALKGGGLDNISAIVVRLAPT
jgi:serine/threonine protein phosphatase PrpC